jgi:hypothetical protein
MLLGYGGYLTLVFLCLCQLLFLSNSTRAIRIARAPVKHEFTKHIDVDAHFTRSHVQDEWCCRSSVHAFRAPVGIFLHEGSDSRPASVLSLQN